MAMEESRLDTRPTSDISHELHLIRQRQNVIVTGHVNVKHMKAILFAQIISEIDEARGCCLGHTIVYHNDVLVEVVFLGCSGIKQRQKVVWKR